MAIRKRHRLEQEETTSLDPYTIGLDLRKYWLAILSIALSFGLLSYAWFASHYVPVYETKVTLVVRASDVNANVYSNIRNAQNTAKVFTQLLNSNTLHKIVAQEAGLDGFSGSAYASALENTNLITLKVDAGSPELSFKEMQAILDNYASVSDKLLNGMILETVEAPAIPTSAMNPDHTGRNALNVFVASLVGMCLLVGSVSAHKDTIRNTQDIRNKMIAPCLGVIAYEKKHKTLETRRRKTSILITSPTVSFRYVETMHRLARRVIERMDKKGARTLLITSVMENEGKTTVAVNLAIAMSQEHKKVLLIDGDFRKPSVHLVTGEKDLQFTSLPDAMGGRGDMETLFQQLPGTQLTCIYNRKVFANSTEMIASGKMKQLLTYLKEDFDYILIDSSPMSVASDAEEFVKMVDADVIVVCQHMVESRAINDAIEVLEGDDDKVIGCIFNNVHVSGRGNGGYGYGYGHYGRYGYGHYGRGKGNNDTSQQNV